MGADYIDYVLADRFVIPKDEHSFYTEKVAYPPGHLPTQRSQAAYQRAYANKGRGWFA
jgi:predicted O-linked N-acetylglucosamine transferase (SPINDLY family)